MYTVVLMAALTTNSATPDWCLRCHCGCSCYCGCSCGGYGSMCGWCGCSCYGGCYRCHNYCRGCGCFACYGCYGCYGGGYWCNCYCGWSCYGAPVGIPIERVPDPKKKEGGKEEVSGDNRAQVVVEVPAEAKLYIDGQLMKSTSARRVFKTPELQPGQTYYYDLKAEVVRDGQTVAETKRVHLRPGQTVQANFGDMATATATAQSKE